MKQNDLEVLPPVPGSPAATAFTQPDDQVEILPPVAGSPAEKAFTQPDEPLEILPPVAGSPAERQRIVNPSDFDTKLSPEEEVQFQAWKSRYAPKDSGEDYDLRGAYKAGLTPDPASGHWADTFKKPNHPTFSDQSRYAKDRPDLAGRWEGDVYVPPVSVSTGSQSVEFLDPVSGSPAEEIKNRGFWKRVANSRFRPNFWQRVEDNLVVGINRFIASAVGSTIQARTWDKESEESGLTKEFIKAERERRKKEARDAGLPEPTWDEEPGSWSQSAQEFRLRFKGYVDPERRKRWQADNAVPVPGWDNPLGFIDAGINLIAGNAGNLSVSAMKGTAGMILAYGATADQEAGAFAETWSDSGALPIDFVAGYAKAYGLSAGVIEYFQNAALTGGGFIGKLGGGKAKPVKASKLLQSIPFKLLLKALDITLSGVEEVSQALMEYLIADKMVKEWNKDNPTKAIKLPVWTSEEAWNNFRGGVAMGGIGESVHSTANAIGERVAHNKAAKLDILKGEIRAIYREEKGHKLSVLNDVAREVRASGGAASEIEVGPNQVTLPDGRVVAVPAADPTQSDYSAPDSGGMAGATFAAGRVGEAPPIPGPALMPRPDLPESAPRAGDEIRRIAKRVESRYTPDQRKAHEDVASAVDDVVRRLDDAQYDVDIRVVPFSDRHILDKTNPEVRASMLAHGYTEEQLNDPNQIAISQARTYDGSDDGQANRTVIEIVFDPDAKVVPVPSDIYEEFGHVLTRGANDIVPRSQSDPSLTGRVNPMSAASDERLAGEVAAHFASPERQAKAKIAIASAGPSLDGNDLNAAGSTRFSVRDAPEWARSRLSEPDVVRHFGKKNIAQFERGMLRTASVYASLDILPANERGANPLRDNLDPVFHKTYDITTMCPQQDQYVAVVKNVEQLTGRMLSPAERLAVGDIMKKVGERTSCWYCYGQSARDLFDWEIYRASQLLNSAGLKAKEVGRPLKEKEIAAIFAAAGGKLSYAKYVDEKGVLHVPVLRNLVDKYHKQLTHLDPLHIRDLIEGKVSPASEFETALMKAVRSYAQGASGRNRVKGFAGYWDQFKRVPKSELERVNDGPGARMNSQSDFRAWHVVDVAQYLTDVGLMKSKAHAYVKEPWFIRIFGRTGVAFNMSMEAVTNPDGTVDWDYMEGFPPAEALQNRIDYENAGTMLMVADDKQFLWGLNSPVVDMMIPFHAGRISKQVVAIKKAKDYSKWQSEDWSKAKKADSITIKLDSGETVVVKKYDPSDKHPLILQKQHKNDKARYLEICKKLNVKPKFADLVLEDGTVVIDHPNYMKVVRDVAMSGEQQVVDATQTNWDKADEFLQEWIAKGGDQTTARPALVEYVRQELDGEGVRHSARLVSADDGFSYGPVYHGTMAQFDEFSDEKQNVNAYGRGFYFTSDRASAERYSKGEEGLRIRTITGDVSRVIEAKLNIKKPFRVDNTVVSKQDLAKIEKAFGYPLGPFDNAYKATGSAVWTELVTGSTGDRGTAANQILQDAGFDAIIAPTETVVFKAAQIQQSGGTRHAARLIPASSGPRIDRLGDLADPSDDPSYTRFPLMLADGVRFVHMLGGSVGLSRQVGRRGGSFKGVSVAGRPGPSQILLHHALFKRVSDQRINEIRADAVAAAAADPALAGDPVAQKAAADAATEAGVKRERDLATTRGSPEALAAMWHHIGRLIDFYPDATLKRGNLLGHLKAQKAYMLKMITGMRGGAKLLSPSDLDGIMKAARASVAPVPRGVVDYDFRVRMRERDIQLAYAKGVRDEAARRGLITLEDITEESDKLIAWWNGTKDIPDDLSSASARYAEMFSVLANNPKAVERLAPKFWSAWNKFLVERPEAAAVWDQIQADAELGSGASKTLADLDDMNSNADRRQRDLFIRANNNVVRSAFDDIVYSVWRTQGPIDWAIFQAESKAMKAAGVGWVRRMAPGSPTLVAAANAVGSARATAAMDNYRYATSKAEPYYRDMNDLFARMAMDGVVPGFRKYMQLRHISENRADIASTKGIDAARAIQSLAEMRRQNPGDVAKMDTYHDEFFAIRKKHMIDLAETSGMFSAKQMETLKNRESYVTFLADFERVADDDPEGLMREMEGGIGVEATGSLGFQRGWLGDITDPLAATIQKDRKMIRAILKNMASRELGEMLMRFQAASPTGRPLIAKAKTINDRGSPRTVGVGANNKHMGDLMWLEGGELRHYYVPKAFASFINGAPDGHALSFIRVMAAYSIGIVKRMFVEWAPGAWAVLGLKDFHAYMVQTPGVNSFKKLAAIGPGFRAARSLSANKPNALGSLAESRLLIGARLERSDSWSPNESALNRELAQFGKRISLSEVVTQRSIAESARAFGRWYMDHAEQANRIWANTLKIAGMKYVDEFSPTMPEWKKAQIVRTLSGNPDFWHRSGAASMLDWYQLYYNATKEGRASAIQALRESPGSYLTNTMIWTAAPAVLMGLFSAGLVSALLKGMLRPDEEEKIRRMEEMMRWIPSYEKQRFFIIPLRWEDEVNKRVLYIRLPISEGQQWAHGLAYDAIANQKGQKDFKSMLVGTGMMDQQAGNPITAVAGAWLDYWRGRNPYDSYRGSNILTDDEMKAGGEYARGKLIDFSLNSLVGAMIGRAPYEGQYAPEKGRFEKVITTRPISGLVGRWVRVSGGFDEESRLIAAKVDQPAAKMRLDVQRAVKAYIRDGQWDDAGLEAISQSPDAVRYMQGYLNEYELRKALPPEYERIFNAPSKAYRNESIRRMTE